MFEALAIALALTIGAAVYFGLRGKPGTGGTISPPPPSGDTDER